MRSVRALMSGVGLAALIALDVLLIVAALRHTQASAEQPLPLSQLTSAGASPQSPGASPQVARSKTQQIKPAPLLSVSSATAAWRASGGCRHKADLAATHDGGKSWQRLHPPVRHILRISMTGASSGWIVAADAACTPFFLATSDGGRNWAPSSGLGQAWVALPDGVRRPGGDVAKVCGKRGNVIALAPATTTLAVVACRHRVARTTDGGATWTAVDNLPKGRAVAVALASGAGGRGVLLETGSHSCRGVRAVLTSDGGAHWQKASCVAGAHARVAVALGPGGSGELVAAEGTWRTSDAGRTWKSV